MFTHAYLRVFVEKKLCFFNIAEASDGMRYCMVILYRPDDGADRGLSEFLKCKYRCERPTLFSGAARMVRSPSGERIVSVATSWKTLGTPGSRRIAHSNRHNQIRFKFAARLLFQFHMPLM